MSVIHPDTANYPFRFEPFLQQEYSFNGDPDRPVCEHYDPKVGPSSCPLNTQCPKKHILPNFQNKIVCKHWLRGLCKKGQQCEYLHEYNLRKMPECVYFSKNGYCTQAPECQYLHVDPQARIPRCRYYDLGFCSAGPACPRRHVEQPGDTVCQLYLNGFCPRGPTCPEQHAVFYDNVLSDPAVRKRVSIRRDYEIHTRKQDEEIERRLNAMLH